MFSGPDGKTCWTLIARAAAGDSPARSRFGRAYLPLIRRFLSHRWRGTRLAEEVEDATENVFVECFKPNGPLNQADAGKEEYWGFLFGVARRVALRVEERERRRPVVEGRASQQVDAAGWGGSVAREVDREWARVLMREAGEVMAEKAADEKGRMRVELLRMRFGRGMGMGEIAAQSEMDLAAVHRQYARAREDFRACLRNVVAFHCARTEKELDDECRRLFELLG